MKLYGFCESCGQKKLFIRKRKFQPMQTLESGIKIPVPKGTITSQKELCGKCTSNIKKMIG